MFTTNLQTDPVKSPARAPPYPGNHFPPNKGTFLGNGRSIVIEKLVGPLILMEGGQMGNRFDGNNNIDDSNLLLEGKYVIYNTWVSYNPISRKV